MIDKTKKEWYKAAIGGKGERWDKIGKWQFDYMVKRGLKPHHKFLDVGCGSFRGGIHFIPYLDTGNYYGLEKESDLIKDGTKYELKGMLDKQPNIFENAEYETGDVYFDYALAVSVFSHLLPDQLEFALSKIMPKLKPKGKFFATFCLALGDEDLGRKHGWRTNERAGVWYKPETFMNIADILGIDCEYIGECGHIRDQKMLLFKR